MKILFVLVKKEFLQIMRDPSSIIIAFILPLISVLIYMYGLNLDSPKITLGIKNDNPTPETATLVKSFGHSKYINLILTDNMKEIEKDIVRAKIDGAIVIPNDFSTKLERGQNADILIITDGAKTNIANYVQNYPIQILNEWLYTSKYKNTIAQTPVYSNSRFWYNPDLDSHHFILPGSIAITMTLIGILLTSLVVAREWERGTMEALLCTSVKPIHIVLSKYIPYFILGMLSLLFNVLLCVCIFNIPFKGNYLILILVSCLFLFVSLGIGLIISTKLKNQFLASSFSICIGFLPAIMLSGFLFPIKSMPLFFRIFTLILPPRHYVTFIVSEFMSGTVLSIVLVNTVYLSILSFMLFIAVLKNTSLRLEK